MFHWQSIFIVKNSIIVTKIIKILRKKKKCVPFSLKGNAGDEIKLCFSFRNNHNWADDKLYSLGQIMLFCLTKEKICIIFAIYDADSDKVMQIKCRFNPSTLP